MQAAIDMLKAGFELSHRLLSFRTPVVAACTRHAIAMGSFLACSTDHRIAAPGYNFQANEVAIGMVLPYPALEVLKLRLTRSAYQQAVGLAKTFLSDTALAGGWVDELVMADLVRDRATEAAKATSRPTCTRGRTTRPRCRARQRRWTPSGTVSTTFTPNSACPEAGPVNLFADRVAIVTGAGAPDGIGVAVARHLVADGRESRAGRNLRSHPRPCVRVG